MTTVAQERGFSYEFVDRISLSRSGNSGDPHVYVFLWPGGTCLGAIWKENEPYDAGDFKAWRRVYRTSIDNSCWATAEAALSAMLPHSVFGKDFRTQAQEELHMFMQGEGRQLL